MDFSQRLMELRKEKGWSQEQLGEKLQVTRQTVSKWETGDTTPEMGKLMELSRIFHLSIDELVGLEQREQQVERVIYREVRYEYKSKKQLFGQPLVHINIGKGFYRAKGIFAFGNIATGLVSVGGVSAGLLTIGGLSAGVLSLGAISVGLLMSIGAISVGTIAIGGLAVGIMAVGGCAIGVYSLGGFAAASKIAAGGFAKGHLAIGDKVKGMIELPLHSDPTVETIKNAILTEFPKTWKVIVDLFSSLGR